ncbi:Amylo-alpha-16-glucosidase [Kribbella flavida DSM 17836]|uniref:Amylo-alpha-16-glucosidase n=1 Tax=Kribbella flavida (strain DSM 17836 / JCM 10339 / NBRC 14399) TaxID=479435 RepID=D2PLR7_KRIFD|nr:glycogen debranching N-terminal domain-containing protein [Kribbella flavida]ADB32497.1 Amylo-alpha-16-glucosidase [Kribbella flavida DSM 17836]
MPALHDLVTTLAAPWVALSPRSGQLTGQGAEGVYARDRRILSRLLVTVDGREPLAVHVDEPAAGTTTYSAVVEGLGDTGHDPTVMLRRTRTVDGEGLTEQFVLVNRSHSTVECTLAVAVGTDLAGTAEVRSAAAADRPALLATQDEAALRWDSAGTRVSALPDPAPHTVAASGGAGDAAAITWELRVAPGEEATVSLRVSAIFPPPTGFEIKPPESRPTYDEVLVSCDDTRVERWVRRSLQDVAALQLGTENAGERYLGAGPPWYLTLFGRDSLISSGMLIPIDPELAAGTLRALARWQGSKVDADAAEQPGKIPHELRAEVADHGGGLVLPAAYYGSHDATQLWITTLHKAWRWGMPREQVEALLPYLQRALTWIRDHADPDGDGFLEYLDESGHGLANQGWKDSSDAVQWPDGTIATAPIALCEVQAYAYAAAVAGAELLTAFGLDGAEQWLTWAAELKIRFREKFWVDGYPAIALDGEKRPVAGPSSNLGHLLGTGLLDPDEEAAVAAVLADPQLDSGFGLRTLSTAMAAFNPLGYHTGSVWPHDTAMAIQGLYAAGHAATATTYARGLLTTAEAFGYRLPELYGGAGSAVESVPTPYPLSCRPQAWAAASAVAVVVAALGIDPHVPAGTLDVSPAADFPWTTLRIDGLRVGERSLSVHYTNGRLTVHA